MPPKRAPPTTKPSTAPRAQPPQSAAGSVGDTFKNTYDALTAKENQSVVRAVGMFGVSCVFPFRTNRGGMARE